MIIIDEQKYNDYLVEIVWGDFLVKRNGQEVKGTSPFIKLNIENKIYIGLELTIKKEELKEFDIGKEIEISKYLTDITYEDEKGWISLITGKYTLKLERITNKEYKLKLTVADEINIKIEMVIDLLSKEI